MSRGLLRGHTRKNTRRISNCCAAGSQRLKTLDKAIPVAGHEGTAEHRCRSQGRPAGHRWPQGHQRRTNRTHKNTKETTMDATRIQRETNRGHMGPNRMARAHKGRQWTPQGRQWRPHGGHGTPIDGTRVTRETAKAVKWTPANTKRVT